jgi:hypothetical protein
MFAAFASGAFAPSRNQIVPTSDAEPTFYFGQIRLIKARKADNGAEKQEKHGELGVHGSTPPELFRRNQCAKNATCLNHRRLRK